MHAARGTPRRRFRSCWRRRRSSRCGPNPRRPDPRRPRRRKYAALLSVITRTSMPSRASSQAVSRRALQVGSRLVREHSNSLAGLGGAPHHAERSSVATRRQARRHCNGSSTVAPSGTRRAPISPMRRFAATSSEWMPRATDSEFGHALCWERDLAIASALLQHPSHRPGRIDRRRTSRFQELRPPGACREQNPRLLRAASTIP